MKEDNNLCSCHRKKGKKEDTSPVPNDGTFISPSDSSFSQEGTVRYGEEADADDL